MNISDPTYWLGRHKQCGRRLRVQTTRVWNDAFVAAYDFGTELHGHGRPIGIRETGMLAVSGGHYMVAVDCTCGGGAFWLRQVRGKYSAEKKCSAKCQAATGPSCECSCAGARHGAMHGSLPILDDK